MSIRCRSPSAERSPPATLGPSSSRWAGSSLDPRAADLATAVSAIDGFSATASGAVITISSTNATSFGTAVNANMRAYTLALGGAAVTGEVWTVTVAGQEHSVTVGGAI